MTAHTPAARRARKTPIPILLAFRIVCDFGAPVGSCARPDANVCPRRTVQARMSTLIRDLRYTLRTLWRDFGFAAFAILIAGLGIGASSTVFSVVNTLLLRPLPFEDPGRLVWISNHDTAGLSGQTTQVGHMLDLR